MSETILLAHGSGGLLTHELLREVFLSRFDNPLLAELGDAATLPPLPPGRLALTTDSYVVQPLFFPGSDIGRLAVCGTVNDLAVSGATPLYLTCGFILEEGLPLELLVRVVDARTEIVYFSEPPGWGGFDLSVLDRPLARDSEWTTIAHPPDDVAHTIEPRGIETKPVHLLLNALADLTDLRLHRWNRNELAHEGDDV